jgi:hypothetical protein
MEPVTMFLVAAKICSSIGLWKLSAESRRERTEAARDLNEKRQQHERAVSRARRARDGIVFAQRKLEATRVVAKYWIGRQIIAELQRTGLTRNMAQAIPELFGDLTNSAPGMFSRISSFWKRGLDSIDGTSSCAAAGALGIYGLQFADQMGIHRIEVLHESLHDFVASLPIDGAADLASPLLDVGVSVGDALSSSLLVFSVFRIGSNYAKAEAIRKASSDLALGTSDLLESARRDIANGSLVNAVTCAIDDASYDLYKTMMLGTFTAKNRPDLKLRADRRYFARLEWAIAAWCRHLNRDPLAQTA